MLTDRAIFLGIALPALVSIGLTLLIIWWQWTIALPAALGIAFMVGYGLLRQPGLPPQDGSDWLCWMTVPLIAAGVMFQRYGARWAWLGAMPGAVVFVVLRPILPAIGLAAIVKSSASAALWGTTAAVGLPWAADRLGAGWMIGALANVVAAASLLVLSSNYLAYGINGMGCTMAIAPIAVGLGWLARHDGHDATAAVRGLSVVIVGLLAGLLAGGRYYPNTGLSSFSFHLFGVTPLLIPLAARLPGTRTWVRGMVAILIVSAIVWPMAITAALAAKHAAETPDSSSSFPRTIDNSNVE